MVWSQSPTTGMLYPYERLREFRFDTLIEILAEWELYDRGIPDQVWITEWPKQVEKLRAIHSLEPQRLIGLVWTRAFHPQICDDGGYFAWLCPYGCDIHKVPLGPDEGGLDQLEEFLEILTS